MPSEPSRDQRAMDLATGQWAALSRRQAAELGFSPKQIRTRLKSGRWLVRTPGVYVAAGAPSGWEQDLMVAVLAGPSGTVASHLSSAALYGLTDPPPVPHVTVPWSANGRYANAIVHHTRRPLDIRDVQTIGPFVCTSPPRTLVDCAGLVGPVALCRLIDSALCRGLASPASVRAAAERASKARGRKGLPALLRALAVWETGRPAESPAEMRLVRLLIEWGFPEPERQIEVRDADGRLLGRVDLGWCDRKAGFEYDGAEFHTPRQADHDALRQKRIEAVGWRLERVRAADVRPPATALRARAEALYRGRRVA